MSAKPLDKTLHARDIYPKWKSAVSKAEESITIYSPYLDQTLLTLLKSSKISFDNIQVITDFDIPTLIEHPRQLEAIKALTLNGVSVYNLPRLHAKVLLVDDSVAILGSQNFTRYARHSKEVSSGPYTQLENKPFVETLIKWRQEAELIDEDLVDLLLSKLKHLIRQHQTLIEEGRADFDSICKRYEHEKEQVWLRKMEELERESRIRISGGTVYASVESISTERDTYSSLVADDIHDMTKWKVVESDGSTRYRSLHRFSMYPVIIADSRRMGFARICQTRITYIRDFVELTISIGDKPFDVEIFFPKTETQRRNIIITIKEFHVGECKFPILFKGDEATVLKWEFKKANQTSVSNTDYHDFEDHINKNLFSDSVMVESFLRKALFSFKYEVLGIENKNITDYLKGYRYRVGIIQYLENPLLLLTKQ